MSIRPFREIKRKKTKKIYVGNVEVGGDAPISVQSMTNTLTTNINKTVKQINEISEAGADIVGDDDLVNSINAGNIDFDVLIATPDMMPTIGKVAKILGPKGLMPNPKLGTVTQDVKTAVSNSKAGQIQYKNDKAGIVHAGIGKLNFSEEDLLENLKTFYSSITKSKPDAVKGSFIKKVSIASTMGFGLEINSSFLR